MMLCILGSKPISAFISIMVLACENDILLCTANGLLFVTVLAVIISNFCDKWSYLI